MRNENKSMSISRFSELTGISRSTLIYYDEIGLFSPAFRGENNYRYYVHQQLTTVNLISVLRDFDVPIKIIKDLVRNRTPENINELMLTQERKLRRKIRWLRDMQKTIRTLRELLDDGIKADENVISERKMNEMPIILGPENDFAGADSFYDAFFRFCKRSKAEGLNLNYPIGGFFDDMDVFLARPSRPSRFFFVNPDGDDRKPEGTYLTGYTRGYYGQTNDLPERMAARARERGLKFEGPVYNIYLLDEISIGDPERYLLQVTVRVS
ncbi:MAG: MerR family DNA-binding transcriptional regulator [Clostridiales Family XIII bacterium]|jgi:DNA-binding transcriptional MerR regulator|nr:MerR family DNA-binding transcriptional regulator [Clostridiales Family XIII bacterium]